MAAKWLNIILHIFLVEDVCDDNMEKVRFIDSYFLHDTLSGSIKHGICSSARNQGYLITLITINPIAKRKVIAYSE